MKVLTIVGEDHEGNLTHFHIINPMNVVVHKGNIQKEGTMKDGQGNNIPINVERTFVRVGGQPLFTQENADAIIDRIKAL